MKTLIVVLSQLISLSVFANQQIMIEKVFAGSVNTNEEAAKLIVELVKTTSLKSDYEKLMNEAFDFLDDEWRAELSSVDALDTYSLSQWTPSTYGRVGQGDFEFCNMDSELASYEYSTQVVGFDTSYKRETTYGFWGSFAVNLDWCEGDAGETKSRVRVIFNKWIDAATVGALLN
jgi:hypothetical protein